MNLNPIRAAVDLVDTDPSVEFLRDLRARLMVGDMVAPTVRDQVGGEGESLVAEEYVPLDRDGDRAGGRPRHSLYRVLVAVAACVAVAVAVVVVRRSDDQGETLRDVDPREALPLGEASMFTADKLSRPGDPTWEQVNDFGVADYERQFAVITKALPECAQMASVGLGLPTRKSVMVHQDFADGPRPMLHDVWVFATAEDASRAMDAIDGEVFPTCWLKLFDDLTALNRNITAKSTSTVWSVPGTIADHGDRQIVFGQEILYTFLVGGTTANAVNAFVQVGRAIAFIDPQYLGSVGPTSHVEQVIAASTAALEKVFGR